MPSTASVAQSFDLLENDITWKSNQIDQLLTYSNFAGTPSISIPYTFINEMPWGINITCDTFEDQKMLNIALTLESLIDEMEGNDEQF